jgi:glycosyltransferase involved in cell wall biosynthesis
MGGPAQQVSLLSGRRMDPERFETLLVHGSLPPGDQSMAYMAEREGARTQFLPELGQQVRPHRDLRALRKLRSVARSFRPHIVHTHTAKAGFIGRQAALTVRPRPVIVHTYHGHVLEGYFGSLKSGVYRSLERLMARRSDCLVGVSEATVDDLVRLGVAPRDRFRVVPLGLDLSAFANLDREARKEVRGKLGVDDGEVLLTYVGRVVPIKRLDVLLHGVARTFQRGAPIRLAVVGDGEIRPSLERLSRELGIADAVNFLGYRADLAPITAATDIAVLSSDNEGTPVSLIEAGAAGCPSVASAVGGVPEVVTDETGILFPPGDEEALARALASLAGDPERRTQMGGRARDRCLGRYSADRLIEEITELYDELLERPGGPA